LVSTNTLRNGISQKISLIVINILLTLPKGEKDIH
jgi:hypothetical protein